jgi:hypothetical protein
MPTLHLQPLIPFQQTWTHAQSWDAFALNLQACYDIELRRELLNLVDEPLSLIVQLYKFDLQVTLSRMAKIISDEDCTKPKAVCSALKSNKKIFNNFNHNVGTTRQSMVDVLSLESRSRAEIWLEAREACNAFLANSMQGSAHDFFNAKYIITVLKYTQIRHEAQYTESFYSEPIWGAKFQLLYRKLNRFTEHSSVNK